LSFIKHSLETTLTSAEENWLCQQVGGYGLSRREHSGIVCIVEVN